MARKTSAAPLERLVSQWVLSSPKRSLPIVLGIAAVVLVV
jgi:hypothetical protein